MSKRVKANFEPKLLFLERMKKLLSEENDFQAWEIISKTPPQNAIRCNTLKISPERLKERLEKKNWKITRPWKKFPEVMIIENNLMPGELGRSLEHLLGYYYIQELSSMLPAITLSPLENEMVLDLCAAPGSKTTQLSALTKNTGAIIANEISLPRLRILGSNLERSGCSNTIITKKDGIALCKKLEKNKFKFSKILVDVPCSGEGTLRSSPKTYLMWNIKTIQNLLRLQFSLFANAFELLEKNGKIIYSTCTHAPEENEGVVDKILEEFEDKIEILDVKKDLPTELKIRDGITEWENNNYDPKVKLCARIYPQDNNTEGFFIAKFKKK